MPDDSTLPPVAEVYQPLNYALPEAARPGAVTAIGVMSIVLGVLGILTGLMGGLWAVGVTVAASRLGTITPTGISTYVAAPGSASVPATVPVPNDAGNVNAARFGDVMAAIAPSGLRSGDRAVVLAALESVRALSQARRDHLDALLSVCGIDVMRLPGIPITRGAVLANLSANGTLAGAGAGATQRSTGGAIFFDLPGGRVEATDAQAIFRPGDGSAPIRAGQGAVANPNGENVLPPSYIEAILARIETMVGVTLSTGQMDALADRLTTPSQGWITPTPGPQGAVAQLLAANVGTGGSITVITAAGPATFAVDGSWTMSTANFAGGPGGGVPTLVGPLVFITTEIIASFGLAIFLLTAGVMTLRQSKVAPGLHQVYAWLKLLAVGVGLIGWWWWNAGVTRSLAVSAPVAKAVTQGMATASVVLFTVLLALGAVYPVVLMIVFRSSAMRAYYASPRPPGPPTGEGFDVEPRSV